MRPKEIVFFLEEESIKEMLDVIMPTLLSEHEDIKYIPRFFSGWQHLEKNVGQRIAGYNNHNAVFIIIRDQDGNDCVALKKRLLNRIPKAKQNISLVRIACTELESFYFGDLAAVSKGLKVNVRNFSRKANYRYPDKIVKPSEELTKITQRKYKKIAGSRAIAPHLSLDGSNESPSFNILITGIQKQIATLDKMNPP